MILLLATTALIGITFASIALNRAKMSKFEDFEEREMLGLDEREVIVALGPPLSYGTVDSNGKFLNYSLVSFGSFDEKCRAVMEYEIDHAAGSIVPQPGTPRYEYILVGLNSKRKVCGYARTLN
ncbi:MAG: hypothetical protein IT206_04935 [Fimbriimonadaceae bacterium]|nr:hypothetical protein [Fimbriimonadaceae bacterium]